MPVVIAKATETYMYLTLIYSQAMVEDSLVHVFLVNQMWNEAILYIAQGPSGVKLSDSLAPFFHVIACL